jgi:aminoglycoside/choline kinase family phosphotransferase
MNWHPPLPEYIDDAGTAWHVHKAWHDRKPGEYVLEVLTAGQPGVRGAHLSHGRFTLLPNDDPELPALRAEREHGEIIAYRPYMRAIIRAEGRYIKVFQPGSAAVPAERCTQMHHLLDPGVFTAPEILQSSPDTLVFKALPGPTLGEIGEDHVNVGEAAFARLWADWSRAWLAQVAAATDATRREVLETLPVHSPEVEARDVARWLKRWLRHTEGVPALETQRETLHAKAEQITTDLLGTAPDPMVWTHGDLHDRQVIVRKGRTPFGLLDFDDAAQAEAARDLANLDVHLELRLRRNGLTPARYVEAHTAVMAVAEHLRVSAGRFETYSDASWLRLACSPLPARSNLATAVLEERAQRREPFGNTTLTGSRRVRSRS